MRQWTLYVAMMVSRVKRDGIKMYENALGVYTHDDCGHSLLVFHSRITNTVPCFTHVFLYCTSMRLTICRCCDGKLKQAVYLRQWQEKKLAATRACRSGSCEVRIFASFPSFQYLLQYWDFAYRFHWFLVSCRAALSYLLGVASEASRPCAFTVDIL